MPTDREILRRLASRWMELAALPVMQQRARQWTALKDLHPERPMVLFEIWTVENYVGPSELLCQDESNRQVELAMRRVIRQAEEIGDDFVVPPGYRVYWQTASSSYGVEIKDHHVLDERGTDLGYGFNHPIRTPDDIDRLVPRTWSVDRASTAAFAGRLYDTFGDILPIELHGTGGHIAALTSDLFRLIGNDNLLAWLYDAPDALHRLMAYLRDDRIAYYSWLESENLLGLNNDWELVGSGSPGYTTALPPAGTGHNTRLRDLWIWMELQETTMISPRMFAEFFLPYMADVARLFGLVYYGCCEPVHDRWTRLVNAMPHIRAVSMSPWCDQRALAAMVGRDVVLSRKPKPWLISGNAPDWEQLKKETAETLSAARDSCLEIIYRDVYRTEGDRARLSRWARMVKAMIGS